MLPRSLSRSIVRAAAACGLAAVAVAPAAAQTLTFNAASQFDLFNTAASPFAAGYYANYGDPLTAYGSRAVLTFNGGQTLQSLSTGDYTRGAAYTPGVFLAGPLGVDDPSFTPVFGANVLAMHPGPAGEISVIRFTAPYAATYAFSMFNQGLDRTDNTTTEANTVFYLGSGPSLYGGTVYGFGQNSAQLVQSVFDLAQGEFVDFALTDGGDGYAYDMTQFDINVEADAPATTTPEPATFALVGAGALALGAVARRRRQA